MNDTPWIIYMSMHHDIFAGLWIRKSKYEFLGNIFFCCFFLTVWESFIQYYSVLIFKPHNRGIWRTGPAPIRMRCGSSIWEGVGRIWKMGVEEKHSSEAQKLGGYFSSLWVHYFLFKFWFPRVWPMYTKIFSPLAIQYFSSRFLILFIHCELENSYIVFLSLCIFLCKKTVWRQCKIF